MELDPSQHAEIQTLLSETSPAIRGELWCKTLSGLAQIRQLQKPLSHYVRTIVHWEGRKEVLRLAGRRDPLVRGCRSTDIAALTEVTEAQVSNRREHDKDFDPLRQLIRSEESEAVQRLLKDLPVQWRTALVSYFQLEDEARSVAELAQHWRCSRQHIYDLRDKALRWLRRHLGAWRD
jgi:hypothetical protein